MSNRPEVSEVRRRLATESSPVVREHEAAAATPARRSYWRSLGELMQTPSFTKWAHDEFPQLEEELSLKKDEPSRRRFLQLMGASMALAGLGVAGCRRPETKIRPYTKKPVDVVIGKGMYYATTFTSMGEPIGVLAQTYEGRPTKIEGNPLHPNSLGGTDVFAQASILELYDPDRSRLYRIGQETMTRETFVPQLDKLASELRAAGGAGLAILMQHNHSPAVEMLLEQAGKALPQARLYIYEPLRPAAGAARPIYDFTNARVIVSLDADIFGQEDAGTRYRRQFIDGRRVDDKAEMNQLYVVEPSLTQTGAIADHRLALRACEVERFAQSLLGALNGQEPQAWDAKATKWIAVLAESLKNAGAHGMVVAGERQGPGLLAVAHEINAALDSAGKLVAYAAPQQGGDITELAARIANKEIKALVMIGGNPAYDAPADLKLAELIKSVPLSIRLGYYEDETSAVSTWHLSQAHYLESWGDARAIDGTVSPVQPMIEPIFAGMGTLELLARLSGYETSDPYEICQKSFARFAGSEANNLSFAKYLQEGVYKGQSRSINAPVAKLGAAREPADKSAIEICFAPDATIHDGRFANNAWLQECPDPITKLTWDNAAIISPVLAKRLGVKQEDVVRIELSGGYVELPVFILPGTADGSITVSLGYGRTRGGVICQGAGGNTYAIRTTTAMGYALGAKATATGRTYRLATTQEHFALDLEKHLATADIQAQERAIVREGTLDEFKQHPAFAKTMGEHAPIHLSIYTEPALTGANQWAMAVDLNACVGCNACVLACQAENNVPVVGKDEVIRGREMHWLRLDRYFVGEAGDDVRTALQPMMCQHCENAPCEPVCPVNATVHSPEGLNEMVYNRCIGTRYCSNNCPYKVRRFNFFDWNKGTLREETAATRDGMIEPVPTKGFSKPQILQLPMQEMLKMAQNPNVTTRIRGVMEKCTYCVQRIEKAKIEARSAVGQGSANAEIDGPAEVRVPSGAVVSACAQACPTQAIVFGDKNDPSSDFYKRWNAGEVEKGGHPRSYQVLDHLNVRPRTHYMAKIRNVNPKLEAPTSEISAH